MRPELQHLTPEDAVELLEAAKSGPVGLDILARDGITSPAGVTFDRQNIITLPPVNRPDLQQLREAAATTGFDEEQQAWMVVNAAISNADRYAINAYHEGQYIGTVLVDALTVPGMMPNMFFLRNDAGVPMTAENAPIIPHKEGTVRFVPTVNRLTGNTILVPEGGEL